MSSSSFCITGAEGNNRLYIDCTRPLFVARTSSIQNTMLQSIKPARIQQHDRLSTTSSESSILAPKQDLRRRVARQTPPPRLAPKTTTRPQQHRRHLSVPDNFLNSIHSFGVDPVLQQKYQINTFNAAATADDGRRHNNFHIPNFLQLHQPPSSHISISGSQQSINREISGFPQGHVQY